MPRRYWRHVHGVGILFSGLIQLALCGALLVSHYSRFAAGMADGVAEATIEAAVPEKEDGGRIRAGVAMAFGALTPIGFLAVSSVGKALLYLVFSAIVRLVAYACDQPCGDPLLTLVDDIAHGLKDSAVSRTRSLVARASEWKRRFF